MARVTYADAPAPLRCPACDTELGDRQDWCLRCGRSATTRVVAARHWRAPLVGAGALLALALAAVVVAFASLTDEARHVVRVTLPPATAPATPAPGAAESEGPVAQPTSPSASRAAPTPPPAAVTAPTTSPSVRLAEWPRGRSAWTVVLGSAPNRAAAEQQARRVALGGRPAGVLDGAGFAGFSPGRFIVFSGQLPTRSAAQAEAQRLQDAGQRPAAQAREIIPRGGG